MAAFENCVMRVHKGADGSFNFAVCFFALQVTDTPGLLRRPDGNSLNWT